MKKNGKNFKPRRQFSRLAWNQLTPIQKSQRKESLNVLKLMRQGFSFTKAWKELGLGRKTVLNNLGKTLRKRKHRWTALAKDTIERSLIIHEKGQTVTVVVNDSRIAALVGDYHNAVKKLLEKRDQLDLEKFKSLTFKDVEGRTHSFETNPSILFEIALSREVPFYEIYS